MARGEFFAVGRRTFVSACNVGLNAAAVLLTLARGSGGDNVTTGWSAKAASKYLGLRWTTAKAAIAQLEKAKIIKRDKESTVTRPRYVLAQKGDLIWLPNALVDGVRAEIPPIKKLRQTQDVMMLRLLMDLYAEQNLGEDGGIAPTIISQTYKRKRIGQRGEYVVWQFSDPSPWVNWDNDMTPAHRNRLSSEDLKRGKSYAQDFFRQLGYLQSMGLIEWIPYLFEGPQGEPIHSFHESSDIEMEEVLHEACTAAARSCLTEAQREIVDRESAAIAAVPAHIEQVQLVGIARLRYRPHTSLTAAWWANHASTCQDYLARYQKVIANANQG